MGSTPCPALAASKNRSMRPTSSPALNLVAEHGGPVVLDDLLKGSGTDLLPAPSAAVGRVGAVVGLDEDADHLLPGERSVTSRFDQPPVTSRCYDAGRCDETAALPPDCDSCAQESFGESIGVEWLTIPEPPGTGERRNQSIGRQRPGCGEDAPCGSHSRAFAESPWPPWRCGVLPVGDADGPVATARGRVRSASAQDGRRRESSQPRVQPGQGLEK